MKLTKKQGILINIMSQYRIKKINTARKLKIEDYIFSDFLALFKRY
jgi:hypothetical protein